MRLHSMLTVNCYLFTFVSRASLLTMQRKEKKKKHVNVLTVFFKREDVDRSYQSMLSAVSRVPGMSIMLYDKTAWPSVG